MENHKLECPKCHAALDPIDGLDTFYCAYCGEKIILNGMSKEAYNARVKMKKMQHKERSKDQFYSFINGRLEAYHQHDRLRYIFGIIMAIVLGIFLIITIGTLALSSDKSQEEHNARIAKLDQIEAEVEDAITAGEYERALFKANQLYYDDDYSKEAKESWDRKRESYIEYINSLIAQESKEE